MGNSKLANGCQAASGTDAPAAPSLNGILAQVPGDYVAAASLTLAPPTAAGPLHQEVEVDAGHVGRVRLFFEQKVARRGRHSHRFWAAYRAEPVHGAWDSDTRQT
ncbi:hypothetical protein CURE108131_21135 [Cupriavidus respiraculi]|uniref:Uncharacterized protein n=1 Tax=Cupriavidus respiraculi TaxID=195930 RepID=A0ABM8WZH3_9BURK|nr:hypothetical protein [Cupriavidus respiraculi]CAG9172984.1 hypothetical protein LMG21510_02127 [Cupriavidus respiraculi]